MRQAWIAGSTGLIGQHLSEKLQTLGLYDAVLKIVRRLSDGTVPDGSGAFAMGALDAQRTALASGSGEVVLNYDRLTIQAEPEADYFCCLGTTIKKAGSQQAFRLVDEKYVIRFAEEAKKNQARCLVVISSVGADLHSSNFYLRTKGLMEDGVRRAGLRSVYILRPSLLLGERGEKRTGERVATMMAPLMSMVSVGPLKKYRPIQAARVAEIAMGCAAQATPGFHVLEGFE